MLVADTNVLIELFLPSENPPKFSNGGLRTKIGNFLPFGSLNFVISS